MKLPVVAVGLPSKYEFSNVKLVLQADGSFAATGTLLHTLFNERITTADGCRVTISRVGSGPVTAYDGHMPNSPGGILKGSATYVEATTVEPCPAKGQAGDSLIDTPRTAPGLFIERPATPVFAAGNLVELNWNHTLPSGQDTFTLVGSIKVVP